MSIVSPRISVILLAGGQGTRMKSAIPKQFLKLKEKEILLYSLEIFASHPEVLEMIIVCDPGYRTHIPSLEHPKIHFAFPGIRRQDSVWNGLKQCSAKSELICIHDGARPLISAKEIQDLFQAGFEHRAATLAVPVKHTIKLSDERGFVRETLDRSKVWEIHTPQIASPALLKHGFEIAMAKELTVTDDVSLVELTGHPVKLVLGSYHNLKITTPEDLILAQMILERP